jgi:hypothetical protein
MILELGLSRDQMSKIIKGQGVRWRARKASARG